MYNVGQLVWLRQAGKLVNAVIIDIDATFITLKVNYKKGKGIDIKINKNSKDIINPNGTNISGFDFGNDFMRI